MLSTIVFGCFGGRKGKVEEEEKQGKKVNKSKNCQKKYTLGTRV